MDEILMLQEEIGELQMCFSEELADNDSDGEPGDQLALQSTLTVLGERMATIRMKASGKRQLLEVGAQQQYLLLLHKSGGGKKNNLLYRQITNQFTKKTFSALSEKS